MESIVPMNEHNADMVVERLLLLVGIDIEIILLLKRKPLVNIDGDFL